MKKNIKSRFSKKQMAKQLFMTAIGLTFFLLPLAAYWNSQAAGTIAGRVFQDYNENGTYDTAGSAALPAVDAGVGGVTVTVYDSSGTQRGTATTSTVAATLGQYSIAATGTGPYRVEFTNLPANYQTSARSTDSVTGGTTTDAGSSVQFVNDGNTSNVNLAINVPEDYCQNNPESASCNYSFGNQTVSPSSTTTALLTFPYTAGSNDTSTTLNANVDLPDYTLTTNSFLNVTATNIGTTFGLAYSRSTRLLYASAFFKRHSGFGVGVDNTINTSDDAGAVYVLNRTGNSNKGAVTSKFTVPNATTNTHNTADYQTDNGQTGWDGVGKTSLGGMATSDDDSALFVMNLENRTLYRRDLSAGTFTSQAVPTSGLTTANGTCAAADVRPFAVTYYRGEVYVGMICSGESSATADTFTDSNSNGVYDTGEYYLDSNNNGVYTVGEPYYDQDGSATYNAGDTFVDNDGNGIYNLGDARKLTAYVFRVNPTTLAFGASPTFTAQLNYKRGINQQSLGAVGIWRPWSATYRSTNVTNANRTVYSQPMLTGITFDNGNMVLGLRDRVGDQVGHQTRSNPTDATATLYQPRIGGDILRACGNPTSGWTLEANGRCGGLGSAPQNTDQGPENGASQGGEFYYGDSYDLAFNFNQPAGQTDIAGKGGSHDELSLGGVAQMPGATDVMTTIFDPIPNVPNETHDGGIRWLSNTTGNFTKAYRIYDGVTTAVDTLGKANGIGDVELLCDRAPIELGNRVWLDTDNDGVQDAGESGRSGVTVRLYNASNTLIATAVTDTNGEYYFISGTAADGDITDNVGIVNGQITPNTNYQIRLDLAANYTGAGVLNGLLMTTRDQTSQAGFDDGSDSDSSLVTNPTNSPAGTYPVIALTTGSAGDNNHNYDIGFGSSATYSIGNRVWFDTDNDGQIDAAEAGISGVSVSLFLDANADGTPDTPSTPVGTMTTDVNGYYRFDSLGANSYVVRLNSANFANAGVLGNYANTTGSNNTDLDSTSVAGQNGENGINPTGAANSVQTNGILSGSIALGAPGEPVNEADVQASGQGSTDAAANMTVDFGFYRSCLGDIVWNDNGAGANNNNGVLNAGEAPIPSVRVKLYDSANTEISVGPDGKLGTSDDATNGMLTNTSGIYSFCGVAPGQYRVVVTTPGGTSSTPTSTTPDDNINSDDNGFPGSAPFAGKTVSGLVTVTPGSTGALNNKTVTNSSGTTVDPTVDFGFVLPVTAIQLDNFTVSTDGDSVSLKWSTGGESGNLGFNLYRETNGKRELVNAAPIAGSALRTSANLLVSSENYGWVDKDAKFNSVYYLEDIDIEGTRTLYGPVTPLFKISLNKFEQNALLLSDLTNSSQNSLTQKEFVSEKAETETNALNPSRQFEIAARGGVKISVNHDGWYKVSAADLQTNGFDVNSNRAFWQLFVGGEEVAIKVATDGAVEFFGRGVDTLATDRQVYYLVNGQTNGARLTEVKSGRAGENPLSSYPTTVARKDRSIYVSSILNGEAENWFGALVTFNSQTVQNLTLSNIDSTAQAHLRVKLQGLTNAAHYVNLRFNDTDLGQVNLNLQENREFEFDVPASSLVEGANSVKLQSVGSSSDVSLIDTVSLSYSRLYKAVNNQIRFSVPAGQTVKVGGFTTGKIAINEIQNGEVGVRTAAFVTESNNEFSFELNAAGRNREFLAVALLQSEQAVAVEPNMPSALNNSANKADLLIVAPAMFQTQAAQLAEMRQAQGLRSQVVLAEDVADEFGFGVLTADALKQFLQNATTNWRGKPHYVVLFGDSSYDSRNYLGQANRNLIPTKLFDSVYMETSSDSWLVDFNNNGIEDVSIGRLSATNSAEADILISKLVQYDRQPNRAEKMSILTADHGFESYSQTLQNNLPNDVTAIRIDRSAMTDAEMHRQLMSNLNNNPLVTVYTGHGSTGVWSNSAVFTATDAANLTNSQFGFYLLTTCLNGYTHGTNYDSLAEAVLKNANGGAIAVWASSGTNFPDTQSAASQAAMRLLFNAPNGQLRIGDIVREAKLATADQDVRRNYLLLGDPTLVIK